MKNDNQGKDKRPVISKKRRQKLKFAVYLNGEKVKNIRNLEIYLEDEDYLKGEILK